ncbi:MAG: efflux RND transporter periplasmic adaptor subunit [Panacagrimonas sp.]
MPFFRGGPCSQKKLPSVIAASLTKRASFTPLSLLAAIGLSLVLSACEEPPAPVTPAKQVGVLTVRQEPLLLTTELAGRTVASEVSEVRPQVGGLVTARLFKEGSTVKSGQPLFEIEPATFQAAADQARANVALAEAAATAARLQAERYADLIQIEGVSQQEVDDAQAQFQQASATVKANQAALSAARTNLKFTTVTAPIEGRIGRSSVTRGALVTANQDVALAKIQQIDPMFVDLSMSSGDYMALRKAAVAGGLDRSQIKVALLLDDGSAYGEAGSLEFSDIDVNEATGSVSLRASFPNPSRQLLPGLYVRATVGMPATGIQVPQSAVSRNPKGEATAWFLQADNKVESRKLTADRAIGNQWLITAGLREGDRLIVEGLQGLRAGATVEPTEVKRAADVAATALAK